MDDALDLAASRNLKTSQRAMIVAKLATLSQGDVRSQRARISTSPKTAEEAARILNVHRATVFYAKAVLKDGTPDEIAAVEAGTEAVSSMARRIRARHQPEKKKAKGSIGKNPERTQTQRLRGELWRRVCDALDHLASLPRPEDVVAVIRQKDKHGFVERRLSQSLQWLKEFEHEWTKRKKTSFEKDGADAKDEAVKGAADAGDGNTPVGKQQAKPAA